MILIAIGSNLPSVAGSPLATCKAALAMLPANGAAVVKRSRWYASDAQPPSDQPRFVNAVAQLQTELTPSDLLGLLLRVELRFGRQRSAANAARTLDLDLIDYDGLIQQGPPILPHPRLAERAFVLLPLAEVKQAWRHPVSGRTATELLAGIQQDQGVRPVEALP